MRPRALPTPAASAAPRGRSRLGRLVAAGLVAGLLAGPLGCGSCKRFLYEGFGRDAWQKPDEVVALLGVGDGDRVADLGAGGGYFTFRLARAVGPGGRVYAVDVDEDMLAHLRERAEEEGLDNVVVMRGAPDDPNLPDGEIDLLLTVNTYHHLDDRSAYFARVQDDLAPNGRVAVIELSDASWFPRTFGHHTPAETIVREMRAAGYALETRHELLERQSFQVFGPDDGTGEDAQE